MGTGSCQDFLNAHRLNTILEREALRRVSVSEQIARRGVVVPCPRELTRRRASARGGALRIISFLSGLFAADVQYNRAGGIAGRVRVR